MVLFSSARFHRAGITHCATTVFAMYCSGLPSHPQHELAKRQCTGFGGMVSFRIKGTRETTEKFVKHIKVQNYCADLTRIIFVDLQLFNVYTRCIP